MALPVNGSTHLIPAYYSFYRPRKDEWLSWPSWLTCSGWLTHISGHPSAAGRAQDRESSPARDRRSTTEPRHQLHVWQFTTNHIINQRWCIATLSNTKKLLSDQKHTENAEMLTHRKICLTHLWTKVSKLFNDPLPNTTRVIRYRKTFTPCICGYYNWQAHFLQYMAHAWHR